MSTYGELKEAIRRALIRDTELSSDGSAALADTTIEYYIKRAIDFYKSEALFFNQKTDTTLALTVDVAFVALPSDFIQPTTWRITTTGLEGSMVWRRNSDIESFRADRGSTFTAMPEFFSIFEERIEVFPTPNQTLATSFNYIFELTALVNDGDSNAWTTDGENLIRLKAQEYIYRERLHSPPEANDFAQQAEREFKKLRARTTNVTASGQVQLDPFMAIVRY